MSRSLYGPVKPPPTTAATNITKIFSPSYSLLFSSLGTPQGRFNLSTRNPGRLIASDVSSTICQRKVIRALSPANPLAMISAALSAPIRKGMLDVLLAVKALDT